VKGSVPDELLGKPLPTLVVRQKGEAWNRPFAAVYHPYASQEGSSVRSVEYFGNTGDFIGITVQSADRTDYVFNSSSGEPDVSHRDMQFKGVYAVIGEKDDHPVYLFLGEGELLAKGKWSLRAKERGTQASLHCTDEAVEVVATGEVSLQLPVPANRQPVVTNLTRPDEKIQGTVQAGDVFSVQLPAGKYQVK
jgi:hypothetical protein